jgi:hypothetical protein
MPDLDKFERRIGQGWRPVYRLSVGEQPVGHTVDAIMKSLAKALRNGFNCPLIREVANIVYRALAMNLEPVQSHHQFLSELERSTSTSPTLPTRLAKIAAECVYAERQGNPGELTITDIQGRLAERFAWEIIDNQCLSPARDGITQRNHRSAVEQDAWERSLREKISSEARKMLKPLFDQGAAPKIRAPRRTTLRSTLRLEDLHKPIMGPER